MSSLVKKCITSSAIIMKDRKILVLYHKKLKKWLYPGGHVDENEVPVEAAIREAKEESGYKVRLIAKKKLHLKKKHSIEQPDPMFIIYENVYYKSGRHMHFDLIYLATPIGEQGKVANDESQDIKWITRKDVSKLDTYENVKATLFYAFDHAKI